MSWQSCVGLRPKFLAHKTWTRTSSNPIAMSELDPSSIQYLPRETLSYVFRLLQATDTAGASSLRQCLLCCKAWYDIALPVLCRDLRLGNRNLDTFTKAFNVVQGSHVRSLTVVTDPVPPARDPAAPMSEEDEGYTKQHGSKESKVIWNMLDNLYGNIRDMSRLVTFSFTLPPKSRPIGFWINQSVIAGLINALPPTCTNLEIDTHHMDAVKPGSAHLCDSIREMLPRLRHLRLRLDTFCPALFGTGFDSEAVRGYFSDFKPVDTSVLQTAMINCNPLKYFGCQPYICGMSPETPYHPHSNNSPEARLRIIDALRVISEGDNFPKDSQIYVLHVIPSAHNGVTSYHSFNRCNVRYATTWVLPFCNVLGFPSDGFLIRILEGQELLSYIWYIEALAEGELWKETIAGSRLPASMIKAHHSLHVPRSLPVFDREAWAKTHPRKSCSLWYHEEMCGARLLDAECRQDLYDVSTLRERTPTGWTRIGVTGDLVRE